MGSLSRSVSSTMLMRPNEAETLEIIIHRILRNNTARIQLVFESEMFQAKFHKGSR